MYKMSQYNFEFGFDGRKFIYNTLTTSLIELDDNIFAKGANELPLGKRKSLISNGFIVDNRLNEQEKYGYYFDATRFGSAARNLKITLLPTYSCNLACPYCYQGQGKDIARMGFSGAKRVLNFLDYAVTSCKDSDSINKVHISLYGGEPMMDKEALKTFCAGSYEIVHGCELPISFDMTTNLTLLDEGIVELIKKYNIEMQVTIDGPKYYHDKKRIYRDGRGTFDDIVKNLKWLHQNGLSKLVTIRINIDKDTIRYAEAAFLAVKDYSPNIYFSVIRYFKGANDCHKRHCVSEDLYSSFIPHLNEILAKHGRRVYRQFGKKPPCTLVIPNKYYVDCNFDVYGCDGLIKHPECRIGTLDENGYLNLTPFYYEQMNLAAMRAEKCKGCKWLPACGGGCPAEQYINSGRNDGMLECQCIVDEESLRAYLIDYIKRMDSAV